MLKTVGVAVLGLLIVTGAGKVRAQVAAPRTTPVVVRPDWARKPTQQEMAAFWPDEATAKGLDHGEVIIGCQVAIEGTLNGCAIRSEVPANAGFGEAALKLSSLMLMKPKTVDGVPQAGGEAIIPVHFSRPAPSPSVAGKVMTAYQGSIHFVRSPNFSERLAAWPRDAAGHPVFGTATFECLVNFDGSMSACEVSAENPSGKGIASAVIKLASTIRLEPGDKEKLSGGKLRSEMSLKWDVQPFLVKGVTPAQMKAAYPTEANGSDGAVKLSCSTDSSQTLKNCKVVSEAPAGVGFGKAALALASAFVMKPATANGLPVVSTITLPFDFTLAETTQPDWVRKPTFDQLIAVYPREALKSGIEGHVAINCLVTTTGSLRECKVLSESPLGKGFGGAALLLQPSLLMKPATKAGHPVESNVTVPITFKPAGGGTSYGDETVKVTRTAFWLAAPNSTDVVSSLKKHVHDHSASGKLAYQCNINKKTGHLEDCNIINSSKYYSGFDTAAHDLIPQFQASTDGFKYIKEKIKVNIAFNFPSQDSEIWKKRYLDHPEWTQSIKSNSDAPLFPDKAAKAGFKIGSATVDCIVQPGGALSSCAVVKESAPDVDFGTMAVVIAQTFVTNRWAEDGMPTEGAHVLMPIKMVLNDSQAEKATPASRATDH